MTRPLHGLPLEDALRRWSDPDDWAEVEAFSKGLQEAGSQDRRLLPPLVRDTEAFKRVFTEFQRRVCDAEFVASAMHENPDPTNPRVVIHPSLVRTMTIRVDLERIVGEGMTLRNPEFFTPDAIPRNVSEVPAWLRDLAGMSGPEDERTAGALSTGRSAGALRGLSIEHALKRWSDAAAWEAMGALSDARQPVSSTAEPPPPRVARHQQYRRLRDPLERELLRKLRHGELIASATAERPDPERPRFVVAPRRSIAWSSSGTSPTR